MENENKTIYDFDFQFIWEYFSNFERQGPGSPEITIKALGFINSPTEKSKIVDIGCGTGGQTTVIAQNTKGTITGIDLSPNFINILNDNAKNLISKNV